MTFTTEEFISSFHSLKGLTLAERNKNLFELLNETQQSLGNAHDGIDFALLRPNDPLEETFKVKALIYFRRVPELIEILKGGDPKHITKVLNASSLLLEEAFSNITGEELIEQIFPRMSFKTKIKALHKMCHCLDAKKAEDFFVAIYRNYVLHLAENLLPCCSSEFILKCAKENRIELTPKQLLVVMKKHPELAEDIFDVLNGYKHKIGIEKKYRIVFVHLMKHNSPAFFKLSKKFKLEFCLGRRATKSFIECNKKNVVNNSKFICKLLNNKEAVRRLKGEFDAFYFHSLPNTLGQFKEQYKRLLALLKAVTSDTRRLNLLTTSFRKIYGSDLWDHPTLIIPQFLELMSIDYREVWMQVYPKPDNVSEELWISFMKIEKSLPLLKKRLSLASNVQLRARIVSYLVISCKVNKDKLALADCCEYMTNHHYSDDYLVRKTFLNGILARYNLKRLEEDHWVHINKLMAYGVINNEHYYRHREFIMAYIEYLIRRGESIAEQLTLWVKCGYGRLELTEKKHQWHVLMQLGDLVGKNCEDATNCDCVGYLSKVAKWNKANPNDKVPLSLYKDAVSCFKSYIKETKWTYDVESVIQEVITSEGMEFAENSGLLDIFFKHNDSKHETVRWLLIKEPLYVVRNITTIGESLLRTMASRANLAHLWAYLRNYAHLGIPLKLVELCKRTLKETDRLTYNVSAWCWVADEIESSVSALSYLMEPSDFINYTALFAPSLVPGGIYTNQDRCMCGIQRNIIISMKNIQPQLALENILNFSKEGRYLESLEKSLLSILHDVSEETFLLCINKLLEEVRLQEKVIRFLFTSGNKSKILEILTKLLRSSEDTMVHKYLFKETFNFFVKNPDDHLWNLFKINAQKLDKVDEEAFYTLLSWSRIPKSYLALYVMFIWDLLENPATPNNSEERKSRILEAVTSEFIAELPDEFVFAIIDTYLLKAANSDEFQLKIISLTCKYLIYCKSSLAQGKCLKLLESRINSTWYNPDTCMFSTNYINNFVRNFCSIFLEEKNPNLEIFERFLMMLDNSLKAEDALGIFLYKQFTRICLNCESLSEIGKELVQLYGYLLEKYGFAVIDILSKIFKLFIPRLLLSDVADLMEENRYMLIDDLQKHQSLGLAVLVILLLPDEVPLVPKIKSKYLDVIKSLTKEKDFVVQLYLEQYCSDKTSVI